MTDTTGYVYRLEGDQEIVFEYVVDGKVLRHGTTWQEVFGVVYDKFSLELSKKIDDGLNIDDLTMSINIELESIKKNLARAKKAQAPGTETSTTWLLDTEKQSRQL